METHLADLLSWLEPHALLLAMVLPLVIRVVGHLIPEELFMISMGVLAQRSGSPAAATTLLAAVIASHFTGDQVLYCVGTILRPRLQRFPRIEARLTKVTDRLDASPGALLALVPCRVFPLGRGAWLIGSGVAGVPWLRFVAVDILALVCHLAFWSGLGWWLAGDLTRLELSAELGKASAVWIATAVVLSIAAVLIWRRRLQWSPVTARAVRTLRQLGSR